MVQIIINENNVLAEQNRLYARNKQIPWEELETGTSLVLQFPF